MIIIKSDREIEIMKEGGKVLKELLLLLKENVREGVTTKELDRLAERFIKKSGGRPAFKGYNGFPASICTSVNEVVIHGIPGDYELKNGDIIGIDVGVSYKGYFTDTAYTFSVGKIDGLKEKLIKATKKSLYAALNKARAGNRLSDISNAVQTCVESYGFSVVREFCGHGVGEELHEDPQIINYGPPGRGPILKAGMTIAIEPMINAGTPDVAILKDGWTVVTKDDSPSAHFEHTIAIASDGKEPIIITEWE
ncbi:MAG: type I methionyl aminopeptidase [candidate division WOR-3 bacterium]|nr:type I methionyl aminopeptidase [candidate division WOR-3 bacterium]